MFFFSGCYDVFSEDYDVVFSECYFWKAMTFSEGHDEGYYVFLEGYYVFLEGYSVFSEDYNMFLEGYDVFWVGHFQRAMMCLWRAMTGFQRAMMCFWRAMTCFWRALYISIIVKLGVQELLSLGLLSSSTKDKLFRSPLDPSSLKL